MDSTYKIILDKSLNNGALGSGRKFCYVIFKMSNKKYDHSKQRLRYSYNYIHKTFIFRRGSDAALRKPLWKKNSRYKNV